MDGKIENVRFCKVISIYDDTDTDRIKVRLTPEDNGKTLEQIDYAFPLIPKMFHVKPKVGEGVFLLLSVANNGHSQRYYIGPVISQDHRIFNDPFYQGADSFMRGSIKSLDEAPNMNSETDGILPNDNDIVIRGRKNADIQITDNDVRIKAGVKITNDSNSYEMKFNTKNPTYTKLKYHTTPLDDNSYSTATIVADKINFLSNTSPNSFNTTDRKDLITDEELNKVIKDAYKLPYGEKLLDYLATLTEAFINHTHDFSMLPTNKAFTSELITKKANLIDNKQMLSNTIRIN